MKVPIAIAVLLLIASLGFTQTIGFQSYILDDDEPLADGQYNITFRIYDQAVGGGAIWQETKEVTVSGGVVSAELGSVEAINTLPFDKTCWVSLQLPDREEMGRLKLSHSPYAMNAVVSSAPRYAFQQGESVELQANETTEDVVSLTIPHPPVELQVDDDFAGVGLWIHVIMNTDSERYTLLTNQVQSTFELTDENNQLIQTGVSSGVNPYTAAYQVNPAANPGPYQVRMHLTMEGGEDFETGEIVIWAQWGVLYTP